jgi:hypothetical protein
MTMHRIGRLVAVLVGAAVLFGLEQGLGLQLYFAVPVALIAYLAVLAGFTLLPTDTAAK